MHVPPAQPSSVPGRLTQGTLVANSRIGRTAVLLTAASILIALTASTKSERKECYAFRVVTCPRECALQLVSSITRPLAS